MIKRLFSFLLSAVILTLSLSACTVIGEGEYEGTVIESGGSTILINVTKGKLPQDEMFIDLHYAKIVDIDGVEYSVERLVRGDEIAFRVKDAKMQLTAPPTLTGTTDVVVKLHSTSTYETTPVIIPAPEIRAA